MDQYLVVFNAGSDDKVQDALKKIRAGPKGVTLDGFMEIFAEVTEAPNLVDIIDNSDLRITKEGRADFLLSPVGRDAVIYTIKDDGTINFEDAVYGAGVDPKYLQYN